MAIAACKKTLKVYTFEEFPYEWAGTQHNLATAYSDRIIEDRADNLETAINYCQEALKVRTFEAFPYEWAITQNNFATIYNDRIRGDRADNLEKAITYYKEVLKKRRSLLDYLPVGSDTGQFLVG